MRHRGFPCFNNAGHRDFIYRIAATRQVPCMEESTAARRVGLPPLAKGKKDQNRRRVCRFAPTLRPADDHPVFLLTKLLALHSPACLSMVVFWWKIAASSRIFAAPHHKSLPPIRRFSLFRHSRPAIRGEDGITCGATRQKRFVVQPFSTSVWAIPSISATSVPMAVPPTPFYRQRNRRFPIASDNADQLFPAVTQCRKVRKPLPSDAFHAIFSVLSGLALHSTRHRYVPAPAANWSAVDKLRYTHDIRHDRLCRAGRIIPQMPV